MNTTSGDLTRDFQNSAYGVRGDGLRSTRKLTSKAARQRALSAQERPFRGFDRCLLVTLTAERLLTMPQPTD